MELLDLSDRRVLVRSWLATLHGPSPVLLPRPDAALPPLGPLVRTAIAWHIAYLLFSFAGALAVARSGSPNAVARSVEAGGTAAVVLGALLLWAAGVGLSSAVWWLGVRRLRS